jgi:hypothetical protein
MTPIVLINASLQCATDFFFSREFPDAFGGPLALSEVSQAARQKQYERGLNGKPSKRQKACAATSAE